MHDLQLQIDATSSYLRLLKEAQECRQAYLRASMPLPAPLLRLLGEETENPKQMSLRIPAPVDKVRSDSRPSEADHSWISLNVKDVSPTTLALALLRGADEPLKSRMLVNKITTMLPQVVAGSVYNLLNRLSLDDVIDGGTEGWSLLKRKEAGVLSGEYIWAPPTILTKTDLAAHRREAIVHVLRIEGALQAMQIVEKLLNLDWIKAPINKDLVKTDMAILEQQRKARRVGNSRKWEAVD